MLLAAMSLGCLICGAGFAGLSSRSPLRAPAFERWSGVCLVLGLGLLGAALQGTR